MIVVWRARAVADLQRISSHIAEESPFAARRVARNLVLAVDSLELFSKRGRQGSLAGIREFVAVIPYVIVYQIIGDRVRITRIWHAAQDRP